MVFSLLQYSLPLVTEPHIITTSFTVPFPFVTSLKTFVMFLLLFYSYEHISFPISFSYDMRERNAEGRKQGESKETRKRRKLRQ